MIDDIKIFEKEEEKKMSLKKGCDLYSVSLYKDCIFAKVVFDKASKNLLHYCTHSTRYGFSCKLVNLPIKN